MNSATRMALLLLALGGQDMLGSADPSDATDEDRERCKLCDWTKLRDEDDDGHCRMFEEIMPGCAQYVVGRWV